MMAGGVYARQLAISAVSNLRRQFTTDYFFKLSTGSALLDLIALGVGVIAVGFFALIMVVHMHFKKLRQELAVLVTKLENI